MAKIFSNKNTPQMWDKTLFGQNPTLLKSGIYNNKIRNIFNYIKHRSGNFLDVGIGMGNLEKIMLDNKTKLEITGIDFSTQAINRCKKILKGQFLVGDVTKLAFSKNYFDVVVMMDVLEHISSKDVPKTLNRINQITKKGGDFIVSVPLNENLKKLIKEGKNINEHMIEYTPSKLKKLLNKHGFIFVKQDLLYAFEKHYWLKSLLIKFLPNFRKPNLLIIYTKKK